MDIKQGLMPIWNAVLVLIAGFVTGVATGTIQLPQTPAIIGGIAILTAVYKLAVDNGFIGKPKIEITITDHKSITLRQGSNFIGEYMDIDQAKAAYDTFS
jgi:ABC-type uncharacterized transport system permease subunit